MRGRDDVDDVRLHRRVITPITTAPNAKASSKSTRQADENGQSNPGWIVLAEV